MKIKICGIKTYEDALTVIEAGADMIGFNFYPLSPRYITPGECMRLTVRLEMALREEITRVTLVGVFVNQDPNFIHAVFRDCHLDRIQLSGDEPPAMLETLGESAYKALRPKTSAELAEAVQSYPVRTLSPAYLVDAYHPTSYGGGGQTGDWVLAAQAARQMPILLAGGLRAENVADAIRQVNPWGVDVASGVETSPGVKEPKMMRQFIRAVRAIDQEVA